MNIVRGHIYPPIRNVRSAKMTCLQRIKYLVSRSDVLDKLRRLVGGPPSKQWPPATIMSSRDFQPERLPPSVSVLSSVRVDC